MRCRSALKTAALGLLGRHDAGDGAVGARVGPGTRGEAQAAPPLLWNRRRHHKMRAGRRCGGDPCRPVVRQQVRPDGDRQVVLLQGERITESAGGPDQDPGRRPGDRTSARRRFCPA